MLFTLFPMQAFAETEDVTVEESVFDEAAAEEAMTDVAVVENLAPEEDFVEETDAESPIEDKTAADPDPVSSGETIPSEGPVIEELAAEEEPDEAPAGSTLLPVPPLFRLLPEPKSAGMKSIKPCTAALTTVSSLSSFLSAIDFYLSLQRKAPEQG